MVVSWALVAGVLFAANAAITGEFNYQGGDRKTFYSSTGFPFANDRETFENIGPVRGREGVLLGDILVNRHYADGVPPQPGLFRGRPLQRVVPYFFPGVVSALLFLASRSRAGPGSGSSRATIAAPPSRCCCDAVHLFRRRRAGRQPLLPELLSAVPLSDAGVSAWPAPRSRSALGALFTAQILLNPFYSSFFPGEHTKSGRCAGCRSS